MRYIYCIDLRMLQVRENEMAQREWSGGTVRLRSLEGTLTASSLSFYSTRTKRQIHTFRGFC